MTQQLRQVVLQEYWEEFDTGDQSAWEDLRDRAENNGSVDLDDFPTDAPEDPAIWFSLYKEVNYLEYENQEEDDWVSDRKGSTEYEFILSDDDGNEVLSD
jgi:hypothetical protein